MTRFLKAVLPKGDYLEVVPAVIAISGLGVLDHLFGPFKDFDVPGAYARYSGLIDFSIYLIFFLGVTRVTLGKRFAGRGGKAISVAVSLILTISLILAERELGFSLASFGPFAGGLVVLVVASTLYIGIRHMGAGHLASSAIAFVATYLAIRAVAPGLFEWVAVRAPVIHVLLAIATLVAIWRGAAALWPHPSGTIRDVADHAKEEARQAVREVFPTDEMKKERSLIRNRLQPLTLKDRKESKEILQDLKEVGNIVSEYQHSPYAMAQIAQKLENIRPKQLELEASIVVLRDLTQRFLRLDASVLARLKGKDLEKLDGDEQKLLRKLWKEEKAKVNVEQKLIAIEEELSVDLARSDHTMKMASTSLQTGQAKECQRWLAEAVKEEKAAVRLLKKMSRMEKTLRDWTELEEKSVAKS